MYLPSALLQCNLERIYEAAAANTLLQRQIRVALWQTVHRWKQCFKMARCQIELQLVAWVLVHSLLALKIYLKSMKIRPERIFKIYSEFIAILTSGNKISIFPKQWNMKNIKIVIFLFENYNFFTTLSSLSIHVFTTEPSSNFTAPRC